MTAMDDAFYLESLWFHRDKVQQAERAVRQAERSRRINAAMAVRAGIEKTTVAETLRISRPTLDVWLNKVKGTADEQKEVDEHFAFVAKRGPQ